MRSYFIAISALVTSGCSDSTPPTAYKHLKDQVSAATGWGVPCFRTIDGQPGRLPDADCYRFKEPQRLRGVAELGFEIRNYYPEGARLPAEGQESDLRLSLEPRLLPAKIRSGCEDGCVLALDFIGRRTAVEGGYGHMGMGRHLIVVDRIVDVKALD